MLGQTRQIRLLSTLGEGGFGAVYLAEIAGPDGFVQRAALKVLHKQMVEHGDIAGRQRDEARLLAQLNHDHIVKVLDLGDYDGRPAVLMEYVEGVDTHGLLQRGPLPPRAVLEITAGVASALDAASTARSPTSGRPLNVVHRDIKPANILVTSQGGVKVLDFGVARADFDREGATKSVVFGTVRFMAPEMWMDGSSGPAVDVYALGVTAWELLGTGAYNRPPLHPERYAQHVEEALAAIRVDADPAWRAELCALLRDMLAYELRARPTAGAVHDRALELAERAPGLALRRWARQAVPPILADRARRAQAPQEMRPSPSTHFTPAEAPPPGSPRRTATPVALGETAPFAGEGAEPDPPVAPDLPADSTSSMVHAASSPTLAPVTEASLAAELPSESPAEAPPEPSSPMSAPMYPPPRRRLALPLALAIAAGAGLAWWALRPGPPPVEPSAPVEEAAPVELAAPVEPPPPVASAEEPAPAPSAPVQAAPVQAAPVSAPVQAAPARTPSAPVSAPSSPSANGESSTQTDGKPNAATADSSVSSSPSAPLSCAAGAGRVLVDLSSNPLGAEVWAEGSRLGTTPLFDCGLPEGNLRVTMTLRGQRTTHEVRVSSRSATSFVWDAPSDRWVAGQ